MHMQTNLMGMLRSPIVLSGITLQYSRMQTMLVFIIHTFVLHTNNMFPGGRGRKAEINNSDKSHPVRAEKGWVTYDWSPSPEICMAFSAARGEKLI